MDFGEGWRSELQFFLVVLQILLGIRFGVVIQIFALQRAWRHLHLSQLAWAYIFRQEIRLLVPYGNALEYGLVQFLLKLLDFGIALHKVLHFLLYLSSELG